MQDAVFDFVRLRCAPIIPVLWDRIIDPELAGTAPARPDKPGDDAELQLRASEDNPAALSVIVERTERRREIGAAARNLLLAEFNMARNVRRVLHLYGTSKAAIVGAESYA